MLIQQIDVTGSRLDGAITKLGMDGPKHHALVLGRGVPDGVIYLAELMTHGYQIATYRDFHDRYVAFSPIQLVPNVGPKSNAEVAQDALAEIKRGGARYDLIANNCEPLRLQSRRGRDGSDHLPVEVSRVYRHSRL
jgi:hypothetical protein